MAIATVTAPRSPKINYSPDRPKMADSGSGLPPFNDDESTHEGVPNIPVEIVSDEEMALIEAALAAARSSISCSSSSAINSSSSSKILFNARSIQSITLLSKRGLSAAHPDIEDLCKTASTQKRVKVNESLLHRFRRKKGFAVTDFTGTVRSSCLAFDWFSLIYVDGLEFFCLLQIINGLLYWFLLLEIVTISNNSEIGIYLCLGGLF